MLAECKSCGAVQELEPTSGLCQDCAFELEREESYTEEVNK